MRRGEILALVGENGAGKSTLIKTCSGAITPTQGEIVINGKSFTGMTPQTSEQNGIGVIYQEFNLVGDLSVAENIFLGRAIRKVFLPEDGYVFLDADYSQIELRVLAHLSQDEKLIHAYEENQDIMQEQLLKYLEFRWMK